MKKTGNLSDDLKELKLLADLLFTDRYCTDKLVREKIEKVNILSEDQAKALSDYINSDKDNDYSYFTNELIKQDYTLAEIEEILADTAGRTNTYVGVKDVELQINKRLLEESNIAREIQRLKRAGIHKVVLLKGEAISNEEMYTTIARIRKSGLQPIIGITKEMLTKQQMENKSLIEESSRFKALAGYRIMNDIDEILSDGNFSMDSIISLIKISGKEISYKPTEFIKDKIEEVDNLFDKKVIFVVDGKQIIEEDKEEDKKIKFKNGDISTGISKLAGEGRLSLYFEMDKEIDLKMVKELIEKIFGKGTEATKTMISLGTTYTANMFAELFKKDAPTKCFSNAYEMGYEAVFGEVSPETVAGAFKDVLIGKEKDKVLTENKTYEQFRKDYEEYKKGDSEFKYKNAFTIEFENIVLSSIDKDETLKPEEKTAMLRQYVMGFMISYIEKHFDEFYEIPDRDWNKIIDIRQMDINVKNQIIYRIMYLLLSGNSPETIKENLSIVDKNQQKEGSMEEIVRDIKNNDMSKEISKMQIKTDSVIPADKISDKNIVSFDIYNDIKILLEDNLLPIATNKPGRLDLIRAAKSIQKKA